MKKLLDSYQLILDILEKAVFFAACLLLAALFFNNLADIVANQTVGQSLLWSEEINTLLFSWICFLGAGAINRYGAHIGVDMVYERCSQRVQYYLRILYMVLALIVVFVMVYFGTKMALFVGRYQKSLYLDISLFYFYLPIPVGGVIFGLNSIGTVLREHSSFASEPLTLH
ncbi:MAG: TRAP transporter small permease [bacterium]